MVMLCGMLLMYHNILEVMYTLTKCVPCAKVGLDSFMLGKFPLTYPLLYFKWF